MDVLIEKKKQPPRIEIWRMFDRIARRYDLLNHLLSLGQDIRWRKKVARFLVNKYDQYILDLATGTGDQLLYMFSCSDRIDRALGTDLALKMLDRGREKVKKRKLEDRIVLEEGDAENIQYPDNIFDAVTISFGIRNLMSVERSLSEMYRVLKPAGRVLILEFSIPQNILMRSIYLFYFRYLLPFIGSVISGDRYAYRYLNETVEGFPYGDAFCQLLRESGFQNVSMYPQTFGIATIYCGDKSLN
ncbi:MAG: bifunctional demethylmenaquinone methyltransferase/2-methoxy-6-polyprenyl-1,4-benzoquinol methylase UbiE [Calditrichia bacterium]